MKTTERLKALYHFHFGLPSTTTESWEIAFFVGGCAVCRHAQGLYNKNAVIWVHSSTSCFCLNALSPVCSSKRSSLCLYEKVFSRAGTDLLKKTRRAACFQRRPRLAERNKANKLSPPMLHVGGGHQDISLKANLLFQFVFISFHLNFSLF